mgnify:CR=1 FL=1
MSEHTNLWNDLPFDERKRLSPYMMEMQILHLTQARSMIVNNHHRQLAELDAWIGNIQRALKNPETIG